MTAITSATTYVTRLRDILATMTGIGTDVSDGVDLQETPGYEVFLKSGQHQRSSSKLRDITRVLSVRVYYTRLEDPSKEEALRIARAAVQDDIEAWVDHIFDHVNLSLDDSGVVITGDAEDSFGILPYGTNSYYGFDIDLTISYRRG